jgi:hypothetical protein
LEVRLQARFDSFKANYRKKKKSGAVGGYAIPRGFVAEGIAKQISLRICALSC